MLLPGRTFEDLLYLWLRAPPPCPRRALPGAVEKLDWSAKGVLAGAPP